jgi:dinuclear metal center YbgI/SA1388 family protein
MKNATVNNITRFLNKTLRVNKIKDSSVNGLQIRPIKSARPIRTVGFGVDACISTFEKARKQNVDLLVVHHGIKWKPQKDFDLANKRTEYLLKSTMALYAVHLPLDLHPLYGNNIQLARLLGLQDLRKFGKYHGVKIGYAGTFEKSVSLRSIASKLCEHLKQNCRIYPFGKKNIKTVGIVSGGGGSILPEAAREGFDCFLVGEIDLAVYNAAQEYKISLITAGHYATETVGVKALMQLVREKFDVRTVFIDDPKDL